MRRRQRRRRWPALQLDRRDAPAVNDQTEVWLDFTVNAEGVGVATTTVPFVPEPDDARSVVIHAEPTAPNGTAGQRLECLPVVWSNGRIGPMLAPGSFAVPGDPMTARNHPGGGRMGGGYGRDVQPNSGLTTWPSLARALRIRRSDCAECAPYAVSGGQFVY